MFCANHQLEPVLGLIAQDVGVPGVAVQRVKDRLFCTLPDQTQVQPGEVMALVVESAEKRSYRPDEQLL